MIELKNITKRYSKTVLDNIDLTINSNEYITIVGKSGTGKSTLMNIIGTLDKEYEGEYFYNGKKMISDEAINQFRNQKIGFIFQQYNLIPHLSAFDNVLLPYVFCQDDNFGIEDRLDKLLKKFNLYELKHQIANTMSGGEQQRLALVRSILLDPDIILADEPTGNLDVENGGIIREFLRNMYKEGKTIIVVTHDKNFAKESEKNYELDNGKLCET